MRWHPVRELAGFLAGNWLVEREIATAADIRIGTFHGTVVVEAVDGELVYREEGVLDLGTHRGPATRVLRYRPTGAARADVHFEHGGYFHDVDLCTGRWQVEHPCRADHYLGEYRVFGSTHWQQRWQVTGPAKDHTIVTDFRRSA
ncbi:hypothetical protein SAMN05216266_11988 [Amycolatopsis marina]|uniref:DUF6314 domain-containing protein n=1 Tax=Amycolatopsis marina TaxID=490629 RepID=A0A1I1C126_9PSEU|nr:DUF6314 family protein [Amycolatopsis marina]SFB56027.1 hypothetical protein SAMN05216266_11988 [Amycolatopsis marina]